MVKHRIAISTDGKNGLKDMVSTHFGKANTFTILEIIDEKIINTDIIDNPAQSFSHGAGPIAIKTLIDTGVDVIISNEIGFGASDIMQQHKILHYQVKSGTNVEEAVKKMIQTLPH